MFITYNQPFFDILFYFNDFIIFLFFKFFILFNTLSSSKKDVVLKIIMFCFQAISSISFV